jgi:hypothetical protein
MHRRRRGTAIVDTPDGIIVVSAGGRTYYSPGGGADSVSFHLQRGDFQKWMKDTLGDDELAKRVSLIKLTLPVEDLRKELLAIVQTRIAELRRELPHHLRHAHS